MTLEVPRATAFTASTTPPWPLVVGFISLLIRWTGGGGGGGGWGYVPRVACATAAVACATDPTASTTFMKSSSPAKMPVVGERDGYRPQLERMGMERSPAKTPLSGERDGYRPQLERMGGVKSPPKTPGPSSSQPYGEAFIRAYAPPHDPSGSQPKSSSSSPIGRLWPLA